MNLYQPTITGSLSVSGSINISGSINVVGGGGTITGTASYATNAELLDGLDSTVFTLTSSFAAQTASFTAFTSSVNTFTASINSFSASVLSYTSSLNAKTSSFATTGSNTFEGIQTINSNLTVTGSITAQTLVVQTITSSVDFVTGSTRFGSLSTNTHVFTGSMSVSGSGTFYGTLETFKRAYVSGLSTNAAYTTYTSAGSNTAYLGVDNSTGNEFTASGGSAYALNIWGVNTYPMIFGTNNTERMRITSAGIITMGGATTNYGRLAVKATTTNPYDGINVYHSAGESFIAITHTGTLGVINSDYSSGGSFSPLAFYAGGSERMRITTGGFTKASNDGSYLSSTGSYHELRSNASDMVSYITNTNATPFGIEVTFTAATPNNTSSTFFIGRDATAARFRMYSNGGLANFQANNVNLSDERTKKDIIPLESYWDKFKAIEIVKFKYKDQTHDDFNIGVIAQQVESIAPEFVNVEGWDNKDEINEEPLKSIYTADLYHATIKVLQEAMTKIEEQQIQIQNLQEQINILAK